MTSVSPVALPIDVLGASDSALGPPAPIAARRRRRILIVDDDAFVLRAFTRVVGDDHEVVAATDGREALRRIEAGERYDALLCDVMMPELSGMAFHAQLTALAPDLAPRVVFMTGGAFTPQACAFLEAIPNRLLEKPVRPRDLLAVLEELTRCSVAPDSVR